MRLGFETRTHADWHVLSVTGEVDVATASSLREQFDILLSKGAVRVAVDLRGVGFMDSTGLSVLVSLARELGRPNVAVITTNASFLKVLELTSLGQVLQICASLDLLEAA